MLFILLYVIVPTLALSLFSAAPLMRLLGAASVGSDVLFRVVDDVATIAEEVEASMVEGLLNMVGTASGFSRLFLSMPKVAAMVESTSKESSVKCSLQMKEYFVTFQ